MISTYKHTLTDTSLFQKCEKVPKLHFYFYSDREYSGRGGRGAMLDYREMGESQSLKQETKRMKIRQMG